MLSNKTIHIDCPLCKRDDAEELFHREDFRHVRCRGCSLVYVNPQPQDAEEFNAALFGKIHPVWSRFSEKYNAMSETELQASLERLRHAPPRKYARELKFMDGYRQIGRMLDVGCANGRFLLAAEGQGWKVSGVEIAPENAALCRDVFGLDVRSGTLEEAFFEDQTFDVVRLNQVIEHVPAPLELLGEVNRVLRTGGLLSLATINIGSFTYSFLGREWSYLGNLNNGHIIFFSRVTLDRILAETGFRSLKWKTTGCRLRNPGSLGNGPLDRSIRMTEKALGYLAALSRKGSRIHVYAQSHACAPGNTRRNRT